MIVRKLVLGEGAGLKYPNLTTRDCLVWGQTDASPEGSPDFLPRRATESRLLYEGRHAQLVVKNCLS
jgi:hypothetical protein